MRQRFSHQQSGFTLVELLVVIGIIVVLFAVAGLNLGQAQNTASVGSVLNTLMSDLKNQQLLAMMGDTAGGTSQQPEGIYFQAHAYTLFSGSTYSSGDSHNYVVSLNGPVTISDTLPSDQVVFTVGDGSISSFNPSANTISITVNGTNKTITLNRFGAASIN